MATQPTTYDESSIKILEGLEPVRLRPSQFTRTDCPLHIIQEVIDNAVDEAIAGYASTITVELGADGLVVVEDNGRGIPVGPHPEKKIPVVEAIFTQLYSGGKFDKQGGGAYTYAGGLHGVGVSVTNALSQQLIATISRGGHQHTIGFADGHVVAPLKRGAATTETGTRVAITPNPKYFDSPAVPKEALRQLLKSKAILLSGLTVKFRDTRGDSPSEEVFKYEKGLVSYLDEYAGESGLVPVIEGSHYTGADDEQFAEGEGGAWAFSWYEGGDGSGASFVNLIPTPQGGTHVSGLKTALFNAVKQHVDHHSMLPKGLKLTAEDVFRNVRYVLSARMLDPSFDNQTKDRLNHRDGLKLLEKSIGPQFVGWLNLNPVMAKAIADLAIVNANARQRASTKTERRRSSSVVMLPGKLADCQSDDATRTELFLVEGDSAGGSAKQGRDKDYQAILPLRGKPLNAWEKSSADALSNTEIQDISIALGVPLHTRKDVVDFSKLRYARVCIFADADVDGFHIQTLLLTLFYRHFPQLLDRGHVYVVRPPLFRIDVEASGKKRAARKIYAMDQAERDSWLERLRKEGYLKQPLIGRFKGLGEMRPEELWDTSMNPETRRLLQVSLPPELDTEANVMFDNLMSTSRATWRKEWMERRGLDSTLN